MDVSHDRCDPVRVGVLSNTRAYREALASSLGAHRTLEVVGAGPLTPHDVESLGAQNVAIVLVDAASITGRGLVSDVVRSAGDAKVIVIGADPGGCEIIHCLQAGIDAYALNDATIDELLAIIESAAHGGFHCPPAVVKLLLERASGNGGAGAGHANGLTKREHEILALVSAGASNKEIATQLDISVSTVKNHVHSILHKLGVARRTQAAVRGQERDWHAIHW